MNGSDIDGFRTFLYEEEKSRHTIEKYMRDTERFLEYNTGKELNKSASAEWKRSLIESGYKPGSINSMLASVNAYLRYIGRPELSAGNIRIQKTAYRQEEDELTRKDYFRLVEAAEGKPRLQLIIQTIWVNC